MEGELLDWEVLHNSDSDSTCILVNSPDLRNVAEIEGDREGMIRLDYFSLDNQGTYAKEGDLSEEGSAESNNPSWIDPKPETDYGRNYYGDRWPDSGSDQSDDRKLSDFDAKNESAFAENVKGSVCFEGIGETEARSEKLGTFKPDDAIFSELDRKKELAFGGFQELQDKDEDLGHFCSDPGGDDLVSMKFEAVEEEGDCGFSDCMKEGDDLENLGELDDGNDSTGRLDEGKEGSAMDEMKLCVVNSVYEGEKERVVVWWKVPFELLRYCVFKVSPVWSLSVAAAVMGFVMLGHRLYKMKRKSKSLQLKVTMDDKKVSQYMTQAARLNEAFSVVRRVPIVRPSLPSPTTGVNPWPVVSLR